MTSVKNSMHAGLAGAAISVSLALLASCAPAVAQARSGSPSAPLPEVQGTIQVSGQAEVSVPADRVAITLTVETEGTSAGEATEENAARMDAVITAVRGMEIPDLEVETFGYSLRPEYQVTREGTGTRAISGYRVQNNIRVTIPDIDATGRVLDRAIEVGANRVANLQFEASDTRQARLEALRRATVSAKEQAEAIASAMGVRLGAVLEVQGGANSPSPGSLGGIMLRAAAEVSTPVEAADLMVTASVTVKYGILEGGS